MKYIAKNYLGSIESNGVIVELARVIIGDKETPAKEKDIGYLIITTNKPFSEWNQVFPNAACVVTIIDRLVHKAEILTIEGDSYRLKEAKERAAQKTKARKLRSNKP